MALNVRRVVTGHDKNGKAVVRVDDVKANWSPGRANQERQNIWTTNDLPVHFGEDGEDKGARQIGTTITGGSVFRVVEFGPGVAPRNHRTDSIDYAVVISGEIDMELDDGVIVKLKAGDALVQRGTIHNWVNRGKEDCVIAFILIAGKPVSAGGKTLHAVG